MKYSRSKSCDEGCMSLICSLAKDVWLVTRWWTWRENLTLLSITFVRSLSGFARPHARQRKLIPQDNPLNLKLMTEITPSVVDNAYCLSCPTAKMREREGEREEKNGSFTCHRTSQGTARFFHGTFCPSHINKTLSILQQQTILFLSLTLDSLANDYPSKSSGKVNRTTRDCNSIGFCSWTASGVKMSCIVKERHC